MRSSSSNGPQGSDVGWRSRDHSSTGTATVTSKDFRGWLRSGGGIRHAFSMGTTPTSPPGSGSLMHWQDASHDWLLVADDQANQLTVYDAADGRPLRRLGAGAVGDVATLARRDGRLFVVDDDGTRNELKLPQLQRVASSNP